MPWHCGWYSNSDVGVSKGSGDGNMHRCFPSCSSVISITFSMGSLSMSIICWCLYWSTSFLTWLSYSFSWTKYTTELSCLVIFPFIHFACLCVWSITQTRSPVWKKWVFVVVFDDIKCFSSFLSFFFFCRWNSNLAGYNDNNDNNIYVNKND